MDSLPPIVDTEDELQYVAFVRGTKDQREKIERANKLLGISKKKFIIDTLDKVASAIIIASEFGQDPRRYVLDIKFPKDDTAEERRVRKMMDWHDDDGSVRGALNLIQELERDLKLTPS